MITVEESHIFLKQLEGVRADGETVVITIEPVLDPKSWQTVGYEVNIEGSLASPENNLLGSDMGFTQRYQTFGEAAAGVKAWVKQGEVKEYSFRWTERPADPKYETTVTVDRSKQMPPPTRDRAATVEPDSAKPIQRHEVSLDELAEKAEKKIEEFFEPAERGIAQGKQALQEWVLEGDQPSDSDSLIDKYTDLQLSILSAITGIERHHVAAFAATQLDLLNLSMGVAKGIPLGFLDVRHVGEGFAQADWQGVKSDLQRALSVIPQTRWMSRLDTFLAGTDVAESVARGEVAEAVLQAAATPTTKAPPLSSPGGGKGFHVPGGAASRKDKSKSDSPRSSAASKLGFGPDEYVYGKGAWWGGDSPLIMPFKVAKDSLKGQGTGREKHHLLHKSVFKKGPSDTKGIDDYIPTVNLDRQEHQGIIHTVDKWIERAKGEEEVISGLDGYLKEKLHFNVNTRKSFTREEQLLIMDYTQAYYRSEVGGDWGQAMADAVKEFRLQIFNRVRD